MTKLEFNEALKKKLNGFPEEDIKRSIDYYDEMIDDGIEAGKTEKEAVKDLGSIDDIVTSIMSEISLPKVLKEKAKTGKKLRGWEVALLILGFPLWFPLLITVAVVIFTIYAVIWTLVPVYYITAAGIGLGAVAGAAGFVLCIISSTFLNSLYLLGGGFVCTGVALMLFVLGPYVVKGLSMFTKSTGLLIKRFFVGKGE